MSFMFTSLVLPVSLSNSNRILQSRILRLRRVALATYYLSAAVRSCFLYSREFHRNFLLYKKAFAFSDYSEEDEGFQILRVTTSLAGYADHSVRSELLLNLYPVNGGFPSFTTAKTGFAKAASRGWTHSTSLPRTIRQLSGDAWRMKTYPCQCISYLWLLL